MYKDVWKNIFHGKVDVVDGIVQLCSKFSNGRTLRHPALGLELKQTQFDIEAQRLSRMAYLENQKREVQMELGKIKKITT